MIELKDIRVGYGKTEVIHGISARFEKGRLTSIIGPNGSGKSTLFKAIMGFIPLNAGEVIINGESAILLKQTEIARRVAYLPQGKTVPHMTVEQTVLHGRFPHLKYPRIYTDHDKEIARRAMEQMGIDKLAHKPLCTLSGGMRQKAYIAMALAQDTEYVLLDEPTTYLDISRQLELIRICKRLAEAGKGVVTVMHDLPLALSFSDTVAVINRGKLLKSDSPAGIYSSALTEEVFGVSIEQGQNGTYCYKYKMTEQ